MKFGFFLAGIIAIAQSANANIYAKRNLALGEFGRCVVTQVNRQLILPDEIKALTMMTSDALASADDLDKLVAAKSECEAYGRELDRVLSNDVTIAQRHQQLRIFKLGWADPVHFINHTLTGGKNRQQIRMAMKGIADAKDASKDAVRVMTTFVMPIHKCANGQVKAGLVGIAAKAGIAFCWSTTGAQWWEVNIGGGRFVSDGIGYGTIGGGTYRDEGTASLIQYTHHLFEGGAILTSGLAEHQCRDKDKNPCKMGDLRDLIDGYHSIDGDSLNIGVGYAPNINGKMYTARVKAIPWWPSKEILGKYMRTGEGIKFGEVDSTRID